MSLSKTVNDSLEAAESELRNALAFAARQERPVTCAALADLLQRLEHVKSVDDMIDQIEHHFSE